MKYLGHVISADMKDDLDIMRQCRQLYAQGNALARRFHMCSDNVKVTIFRSSLYTSQLWWKYKVNSIRKLYVAYNNAFVCYSCYPVIVVQAACLLYITL